jgi:hypothetical protein
MTSQFEQSWAAAGDKPNRSLARRWLTVRHLALGYIPVAFGAVFAYLAGVKVLYSFARFFFIFLVLHLGTTWLMPLFFAGFLIPIGYMLENDATFGGCVLSLVGGALLSFLAGIGLYYLPSLE